MIFDLKLGGFLVMEGGYAISRMHFVDFKVAYSFQFLTNSLFEVKYLEQMTKYRETGTTLSKQHCRPYL